jgi:L-alanine-DL-glutamate epimerase-like enolase superfamily enzyme
LSASLQPFAGIEAAELCEYPAEASPLAEALTLQHLEVSSDGFVHIKEGPGLGIEPDRETVRAYLVDVEIVVNGNLLYRTPGVP